MSSLELLTRQRSHVLFVLGNPETGRERRFIGWRRDGYRKSIADIPGILSGQHYERDEVDITQGRYEPLPYQYLGVDELSVDEAEAAAGPIARIDRLHREQGSEAPATWLYFPVSERVGRSPAVKPSMLTLAFANEVPDTWRSSGSGMPPVTSVMR